MAAKTKKTDPIALLERQLQEMAEDYLLCRELRHQWDGYTARYMPEDKRRIERTLKCKRCKAEKDQEISARDGSILWTSSVRYPEGYLFTGVGRLTSETMGVVRLASVTNQLFKQVKV